MSQKLLTSSEVAEQIGVAINTLKMWRAKNKLPKFIRLNGKKLVRYKQSDIDDFIAACVYNTEHNL